MANWRNFKARARNLTVAAGLAGTLVAVAPGAQAATFTAADQLYVTTTTPAAKAMATATGSTRDALAKIAAQPQAQWVGGSWVPTASARSYVSSLTAGARSTGTVLPLVVYNIPNRDCGSYSAGGAADAAGYRAWIAEVAAGIGGTRTMVILEPDALAQLDCLTPDQQALRLSLIQYAAAQLTALPNTSVYLDAGNANWRPAATMAQRLAAAGVSGVSGFAINVANFDTTTSETAYGQAISALVGSKHFIIDTSRNGNGAATGPLSWCNPPGRALGERPTLNPGIPGVDALLWVKTVGNSDGQCRPGEAPAGTFSVDYAVGLATAAHW